MNRKNVVTPQQVEADLFLQKHLNPPPGKPAPDVTERILHWLAVANNPNIVAPATSAANIANVRRKARQNLRRLVLRHPEVAAQVDATSQTQVCA